MLFTVRLSHLKKQTAQQFKLNKPCVAYTVFYLNVIQWRISKPLGIET